MLKLLFSVLLLILASSTLAQETLLIGPVVYGEPMSGHVIFQDLGTGEVWEIDGEALIPNGRLRSWSPDGCLALYGNRNTDQYALIDVQKRTITRINLSYMPHPEARSKEFRYGRQTENV